MYRLHRRCACRCGRMSSTVDAMGERRCSAHHDTHGSNGRAKMQELLQRVAGQEMNSWKDQCLIAASEGVVASDWKKKQRYRYPHKTASGGHTVVKSVMMHG